MFFTPTQPRMKNARKTYHQKIERAKVHALTTMTPLVLDRLETAELIYDDVPAERYPALHLQRPPYDSILIDTIVALVDSTEKKPQEVLRQHPNVK